MTEKEETASDREVDHLQDETGETVVAVTPTLSDSKLYTLARTVTLLEAMVPEISTQMAVELSLMEDFPRTEEDGDSTRVLINYTNHNGRSMLFKINDHDRLNNTGNIDHFLSNFGAFMADTNLPEDPVEQMRLLVLAGMTFSVSSVLEMEQENSPVQAKALAEWFLKAITAILYDDPLDVVIAVQEVPQSTGEGTSPTVVAIWAVKQRQKNTDQG